MRTHYHQIQQHLSFVAVQNILFNCKHNFLHRSFELHYDEKQTNDISLKWNLQPLPKNITKIVWQQ